MIDLYLIRHAESEANVREHLVGGRNNDALLTPKGELQAWYLGQRFRKEGAKFDEVYASTAVRAQRTAQIVCEEITFPLDKIRYSSELLELDQGDWQGKPRSEIYTSETLAAINADNLHFTPPNGESQRRVEERMITYIAWETLGMLENRDYKVALFSHGMAIKCLLRRVLDSNPALTYRFHLENTSITRIQHTRSKQGWDFVSMNDTAHLVNFPKELKK